MNRLISRQRIWTNLFGATLALIVAPQPMAEIMEGRPDAIVCSVKDPTGVLPWEQLVYYVSARMTDGRTLYKTLTSDPVVILVRPDGVVEGQNLADCGGKTIDELFRDGRAFVLTSPGGDRGAE